MSHGSGNDVAAHPPIALPRNHVVDIDIGSDGGWTRPHCLLDDGIGVSLEGLSTYGASSVAGSAATTGSPASAATSSTNWSGPSYRYHVIKEVYLPKPACSGRRLDNAKDGAVVSAS